MPVTFLTKGSYARLKGYEGMKSLNISFSFRTYEEHGLMAYHEFSSTGHLKVNYLCFLIILNIKFYFFFK